MGDLYLTLLGPPEVRHADQMLLFSTRKELALLIYLAVEGRVHSRRNSPNSSGQKGTRGMAGQPCALPCSICVTCWVRAPMLIMRRISSSNATLSVLISLRYRTRPPYPPRSLHVGACVDPHDSDHVGRGASHPACQAQRAISLPRGEFLEASRSAMPRPSMIGFGSNASTGICARMRSSTASPRMQFEAGELEAAIETVNRWLVLSPLHEDAYRRLMRLHFAAGDRAAALHAYDICWAMLATGMQTEPTQKPWRWSAACGPLPLLDARRHPRPRSRFPQRCSAKARSWADNGVEYLDQGLSYRPTRSDAGRAPGRGGWYWQDAAGDRISCLAEMEGADVLQGQAFETGGQLPYRPVMRPCARASSGRTPRTTCFQTCGWRNSRACSPNCATVIPTCLTCRDKSVARIGCSRRWRAWARPSGTDAARLVHR